MSIGLALIARDEADQLPGLLSSIAGAFDQVALLDTGSEDRTVEVFEKWASRQRLPLGYEVGHFEWIDDFAAARNAADDLLGTDWHSWADCDDEVIGADRLREIACRAAASGAHAVAFDYLFGPVVTPDRVRLVTAGTDRWVNPIHEHYERGIRRSGLPWSKVPNEVCCWRHRRSSSRSFDRNLRILRAWVDREPTNSEALWLALREEFYFGDKVRGVELARRFLESRGVRRCLGTPRLTRARQMIQRLEIPGAGDLGMDLAAVLCIDFGEVGAWPAEMRCSSS